MNDRVLYFAYGSNMSIERLKVRVPSAELVCVGTLTGHQLRFHKPSKKDDSGKCDAAYTGSPEDSVLGVLYSIQVNQLAELDRFEGCGYGYQRKTVAIHSGSNEIFKAETYIATHTDSRLRPLDWYKEHVLRGAKAVGLPSTYIAMIEAVVADADSDEERRARELAIYG
jgi:gamma-glutamylcyclotransferase